MKWTIWYDMMIDTSVRQGCMNCVCLRACQSVHFLSCRVSSVERCCCLSLLLDVSAVSLEYIFSVESYNVLTCRTTTKLVQSVARRVCRYKSWKTPAIICSFRLMLQSSSVRIFVSICVYRPACILFQCFNAACPVTWHGWGFVTSVAITVLTSW